jgi:hypothetical protein
MQLHDVDLVRFQPPQTALNAFQNRGFRPISSLTKTVRMTALGEKIKFFSATAHCLSDQFFAVVVTFRGIDHIQTGIERAIQQFSDSFRRRVFVADLGSSKSEDRDIHVGLSKATLFHCLSDEPRIARM